VLSKVVPVSTLLRHVSRARHAGKKIAFTNGCFDILHAGHVRYLTKAKKGGRCLIVGLNSDRSVRRIKGPQRPVNKQRDRAEVLAALECVDWITVFHEDTPYRLIQAVKPDILIKGADWKGKTVVGEDIVNANGGCVELVTYVKGLSTTHIIETIRKTCGKS
jgi:D-beta-D-heptose 7-phosphate kinase/D-beta-D-heptose 1-phosphate adenosyltransferase